MKEKFVLGMEVKEVFLEVIGREGVSYVKRREKLFWGNSMCKDFEVEIQYFEELRELKEDMYVCNVVSKGDKGLFYGFDGKKSWGGKELGF